MADSALHALWKIIEATYGTTPATPAWTKLRNTGVTAALAKGTMVSEEMRADRNVADLRHGNRQVGGDINGELIYGAYDDELQAVLGGTWAAKFAPVVATDISAVASDNSINSAGGTFPAWEVGDKVTISGFTGTAGNNQAGVVVSRTASKVILTTAAPFVDDAAGESVTVTTNTEQLKNGTTRRSFSLLRDFTDLSGASENRFHIFTGQEYNTLALGIGVEGLVSIGLGLMGKNQGATSDTAPASSTYVDTNANKPFDSLAGALQEGGTDCAVATEITINLDNGFQPRFTVASNTTRRPSVQRCMVTGQFTAYAESAALLNKFLNETESSLMSLLIDPAGNKMRVKLPRIKYTGGQMDTQGQGPVTIALPFQALYDSTSAASILIERIPV